MFVVLHLLLNLSLLRVYHLDFIILGLKKLFFNDWNLYLCLIVFKDIDKVVKGSLSPDHDEWKIFVGIILFSLAILAEELLWKWS